MNILLTSDIHTPVSFNYIPQCRRDNYWKEFKKKIKFIKKIKEKYNISYILDGGDLCHKTKLYPEVESWLINNLPYIITIPGNHDIPNHNLKYLNKSSLKVLESAKVIKILYGTNNFIDLGDNVHIYGYGYEEKIKNKIKDSSKFNILICHVMIFDTDSIIKGLDFTHSLHFLKNKDVFDLIIAGHSHARFITELNKRKLISPGALMRSKINQKEPYIYILNTNNFEIKEIKVPIKKDIYDLTLYNLKETSKIKEYVDNLEFKNELYDLDIEKNLELYMEKNKIDKKIKIIIEECKNGYRKNN